jgi:hypothetical protein
MNLNLNTYYAGHKIYGWNKEANAIVLWPNKQVKK